jgi:hypothetical protein
LELANWNLHDVPDWNVPALNVGDDDQAINSLCLGGPDALEGEPMIVWGRLGAELSDDQRAKLEDGNRAAGIVQRAQSVEPWLVLGRGLDVAESFLMATAGTNRPAGLS